MKNKFLQIITIISLSALIALSSTVQLYAANSIPHYNNHNEPNILTKQSQAIPVSIRLIDNSQTINGKLISNTTYVSLRTFLNAIGQFKITWNQKHKTASAVSDKHSISAAIGNYELIINNKTVVTHVKNLLIENVTYIPLRPLAEALGYDVKWDQISKSATLHLNKTSHPEENFGTYAGFSARSDSYYDKEDLYWLSRIISAESRGESFEGKLAVGNVVMNRVASHNYPNSIKEVIFDEKYGIQFTPVANGAIYQEPTSESIFAAKIILEGYNINTDIIYFVDTKVSPNSWVELNNTFVFKIGCHSFFK